jgi:hypothetical protein
MTSCTCGREWTGLAQAHCSVSRSAAFGLAPRDGDASLLAHRHAHLDEAPIDGGWITPDLATYLVSAQSGGVEGGGLFRPRNCTVNRVMLGCGQWTQVLWAIVGPVPVDVVHVLLSRDPAINHPVLIGFDIAPRSDAPAEQNIAVTSQVPTRLVLRSLLARSQRADGSSIPGVLQSAIGAATTLGISGDGPAAVAADDGSHAWSLQVSALCHRHFSTVANFDKHQPNYTGCKDPAALTNRKGEPILKQTVNRFGVTWVGVGEHPEASGDSGNDADPGMAGAA